MQPKLIYPRWYHTFRGFVGGLAIGIGGTTLAYESGMLIIGNPIWQRVFLPLVINGIPWLVLALFETYFGIQRYRALWREIDRRAAAV